MTRRFVLQLAGHPGSGKSTLAQAIGEATGAIVLDKDVVKTQMLDSGVPEETASALAYDVFFAIGAAIARQRSVVLDSPAYFPTTPAKGRAIAEAASAEYYVIECHCPDREELQSRLDSRTRMASQMTTLRVMDDPYARAGTGPLSIPHLMLDMTQHIEACLEQALAYIAANSGRRFPIDGRQP